MTEFFLNWWKPSTSDAKEATKSKRLAASVTFFATFLFGLAPAVLSARGVRKVTLYPDQTISLETRRLISLSKTQTKFSYGDLKCKKHPDTLKGI